MGSVFESSTKRWRRASCSNRSSPRMGSRSRALFHAAQNCSNVCVDCRRRARCTCHSRGSIRPSCHSRHRGSVSIAVQTCSGERLAPPPSVVRARFRLTLTITRPRSDGLQIEGAVPRCAELLKCVCGLQAASEMHLPFTRLDPPFLPLTPPRIGFDRGPDLLGREVGAAPERGQSAFQVDAHDYPPDVKNDCLDSPPGLWRLRACAGELGHG